MSASNTKNGPLSKWSIYKNFILLISLCLWVSPAAAAESPRSVVQKGTDQVLNILKQNPGNSRADRKQIQSVVNGYFDFERMSRLAVGPRWKSVSQEKRQEFTHQFSKLLFNTYIGDIEKYAGQKITYSTKSKSPGSAVIEASIYNEGNPIYLDYFLYPKDGTWKVYDVSVSGVSLAVNYHAQFNSILTNGSFQELLSALKRKNAQLCSSGRC